RRARRERSGPLDRDRDEARAARALETEVRRLADRGRGASGATAGRAGGALELRGRPRAPPEGRGESEERLHGGCERAFRETKGRGHEFLQRRPKGADRPGNGEGEAAAGLDAGRRVAAGGGARDGGSSLRAESGRGREAA